MVEIIRRKIDKNSLWKRIEESTVVVERKSGEGEDWKPAYHAANRSSFSWPRGTYAQCHFIDWIIPAAWDQLWNDVLGHVHNYA